MCPVCLATAALIAGIGHRNRRRSTALVAGSILRKRNAEATFTNTASRRIKMATQHDRSPTPKTVSHDEWIEARKQFLQKEKEFTRLRDELSRERRELPWEEVEKNYRFRRPARQGEAGRSFRRPEPAHHVSLHAGPGLERRLPRAARTWPITLTRTTIHLAHRDVTLALSRARPMPRSQRSRSAWAGSFTGSPRPATDFNFDYHVSFTKKSATGKVYYNYTTSNSLVEEGPGLSVFAKDPERPIYHTYSSYGRGLDILVGTYNFLDLVPKGRDEDGLKHSMAWVRHHDKYDGSYFVDANAPYEQPKPASHSCCSGHAAFLTQQTTGPANKRPLRGFAAVLTRLLASHQCLGIHLKRNASFQLPLHGAASPSK